MQEPHSVTLLVKSQSGDTKLLQIRCDEPMCIRDLLKRYDIHCDTVWNDTMSLSSNSPCIALTDHGMDLIYTEATPGMITGRSTAGPKDTFDHRMKHLKVRTKHRTMKNKPYSIPTTPQNAPRGASLLDDDLTQEDSNPTLPTVLYYSDPLSTVADVLRNDGRFLVDCQLAASYDDGHNVDAADVTISGESPICQWQHNQLCIVGTTTDPPDEDHMFTYPYECTVCREESDVFLECGHLCCQACITSLGNKEAMLITCPLCKQHVGKKNITTTGVTPGVAHRVERASVGCRIAVVCAVFLVILPVKSVPAVLKEF